ncbi:MAG: PEP-CTERM sorting domain-containing protein [Verrucomicrobia bacterium]|nr:PEP-CTERM sorting domain-containing protein [Verrucomicrobiota bacterium]MCH8514657.1 PEP-CTERM sorting domain-containing protein [Kiritimatiellia bacterium]
MNAQLKKLSTTLALLAGLSVGVAQADIILAQWTFASNMNATTAASDVTASAVTLVATTTNGPYSSATGINLDGSSYVDGNAINRSTWSGEGGRAFGRVFNDLDEHYFAFSITLDPGTNYQLKNVQFDAGFRTDGVNHMRVQYSFSSDFSNPVTIGEGAGWLEDPTTGLDYGPDADFNGIEGLPSLGVQRPGAGSAFSWNRFNNDGGNVAISDTVYFRIQGAGSTGTDADANFYIDNVTITAIPEPSTLVLLGIVGVAGLIGLRRRRK